MKKDHVIVDAGNSIIKVLMDDILFIEKDGRRAIIVTEKEEISWYRTLEQMREVIDDRFIDCHRSYLINMDKIERMEGHNIWIKGGYVINFGRESYRKAKCIFREYLKEQNR